MGHWVQRVNGHGRPFQQWFPSHPQESLPEFGPGTASPDCPICGAAFVKVYPPKYHTDGVVNAEGEKVRNVASMFMLAGPEHLRQHDPWDGDPRPWALRITHDTLMHETYNPATYEREVSGEPELPRPRRAAEGM
jgi:hypothetical protein